MLLRSQATFPDVSEAGSSQTSPIPELGSAGPSQRTVGRSKAPAKRRTREKRFLKVSQEESSSASPPTSASESFIPPSDDCGKYYCHEHNE